MTQVPESLTGIALLHNPRYNKSTAFTEEERDCYHLHGLLPASISTQGRQIERILENIRRKAYDIERYVFLSALQSRNERLFYRLLIDHVEEMLPLVYTPTVGQACQEFAHIFRETRGFYVTLQDKGRIYDILGNWPEADVRLIVITDGERILGLGDLGANGMGIPIGKLSLYSAFAGIPPEQCLPVMLDVGTNNETLRNDPLYLGLRRPRLGGADYLALVDEFVDAVQRRYPKALIQFEDFLTPNAYGLLNRYRKRVRCFNDDIQGTAAVALAGILAACRRVEKNFQDLTVLFLGAGSAATGMADLLQVAFMRCGLSEQAARQRLWFVDIDGLLVASRTDLAPHNRPFAHDAEPASFLEAINRLRPDVLIGASGAPNTFTEPVIRAMAAHQDLPIIFALSNPTSRAECTAESAYQWSDGRALFASGSPFAPVSMDGQTFYPGQGNNAYIFPGIGLGALVAAAETLSDDLFLTAAQALADSVSDQQLARGSVYPPLAELREVSVRIAIRVAERVYRERQLPIPDTLPEVIREAMFDPSY
ncbi:MAG: NAD-dependent malic enzyme [Methylococcales bacterium]|nr:NAD-dependent malic enzyme [Methylococcales bacterium]